MVKKQFISIRYCFIALVIVSGCTAVLDRTDFEKIYGPSVPRQRIVKEQQYKMHLERGEVSFQKQIKPILDNRCVVCHACYDAPCQLKLGSIEGLDRGATKQLVYDSDRLTAVSPTRLFIDATSTEQWRKKGFYPVLNEGTYSTAADLDNSILAKMVQLKRLNPLPETGKLDKSFKLDLSRSLECPDMNEFSGYQSQHPLWGMPYAMPGLTLKQEYTLFKWLQEGAQTGPLPKLSKQAKSEIKQWETFFNGPSLKEKLVARYIYEHLFLGHIHFKGHPDEEFFYLVRSSTPPGTMINELKTVRPFSPPGVDKFYYRLRPIISTIVDKTHLVYELSKQKMQRYQALFFHKDYVVSQLPTYQTEIAANPFKTFRDIPRVSRYKFLLDNAEFFVAGFIKGPVCRGQIALNVIRDRFWVAFLNPDLSEELKFSKQYDDFLAEQNLSLPASDGDNIGLLEFRQFDKAARTFSEKNEQFVDQVMAEHGGIHLNAIWDGGQVNQNAALTVFRHTDSATVVKGWLGETPLSAWIVGYPILERIHYLLVAGFNVYGPIAHQLATRTYMDYLRMGSENNFLRFMPIKQRKFYYDSWYKGLAGRAAMFFNKPFYSLKYQTGIKFKGPDYKTEFFDFLRNKMGEAAGAVDSLNDCQVPPCVRAGTTKRQQQVDQLMRKIAQLKGEQLALLPDVSFIRIKTEQSQHDLNYSLVLNKALDNVAVMFLENMRRVPAKDTVTVIPGLLGSYPSFFFEVNQKDLPAFTLALVEAQSKAEIELFYSTYGVRRSNPTIWAEMDWFNQQHKIQRSFRAGLFDMSRYQNL